VVRRLGDVLLRGGAPRVSLGRRRICGRSGRR
jgi:hypothetical protein